ncbi:hypothetical protein B4168_2626 [Anoxybacillus flavithermus]|nr:hypothetical protein B4168_2626 [Anoxybacillus flavithermus]
MIIFIEINVIVILLKKMVQYLKHRDNKTAHGGIEIGKTSQRYDQKRI